jgi:hypothetical protein
MAAGSNYRSAPSASAEKQPLRPRGADGIYADRRRTIAIDGVKSSVREESAAPSETSAGIKSAKATHISTAVIHTLIDGLVYVAQCGCFKIKIPSF